MAPEGKPLIADPELTPELLSLAHLTSVQPWVKTMWKVLEYHREYRKILESQPKIKIVETAGDLHDDNKINVVLGLQNPPENADGIDFELLFKEGIRITLSRMKVGTSTEVDLPIPKLVYHWME